MLKSVHDTVNCLFKIFLRHQLLKKQIIVLKNLQPSIAQQKSLIRFQVYKLSSNKLELINSICKIILLLLLVKLFL